MFSEIKLNKPVRQSVEEFRKLILDLSKSISGASLSEIIDQLVQLTDYKTHLLKQSTDKKLKDNVLDNIKIMKQVVLENEELIGLTGHEALLKYINVFLYNLNFIIKLNYNLKIKLII